MGSNRTSMPSPVPDLDGGFVQDANDGRRRAMYLPDRPGAVFMLDPFPSLPQRVGDWSRYHPVIVLRGPSAAEGEGERRRGRLEFYCDHGTGSELLPLPAIVADSYLGTGIERLADSEPDYEQLQGPASVAAVESMPTIEIGDGDGSSDAHCAICNEDMAVGAEAREMPCKHRFHSECVLPWLSVKNTCPVCRHELPADVSRRAGGEEETAGYTIRWLPGGGFVVGRLVGGRRSGERVVYTEVMAGERPARVSWTSRGSRVIRSIVSFFSFFNRRRPSSSSSSSSNQSQESGRGHQVSVC